MKNSANQVVPYGGSSWDGNAKHSNGEDEDDPRAACRGLCVCLLIMVILTGANALLMWLNSGEACSKC